MELATIVIPLPLGRDKLCEKYSHGSFHVIDIRYLSRSIAGRENEHRGTETPNFLMILTKKEH